MRSIGEPARRELAKSVGTLVEGVTSFALDQVDDLALLLLQRAAAMGRPPSPRARVALLTLRRAALAIPATAGRAAAVSTYLAVGAGNAILRTTGRLMDRVPRP